MTDFDETIRNLRAVVFDFDGVFTTNEVIVSDTGEESVICNRSDSYALRLLRAQKLEMLILSTEANPVVSARAKKMKMECVQNIAEKGKELVRLMETKSIPLSQVAYVGNDVNDLKCFGLVGLPVAVADAFPEAKAACRWVLKNPGGKGAVRELCETIYRVREKLTPGESPWGHFSFELA